MDRNKLINDEPDLCCEINVLQRKFFAARDFLRNVLGVRPSICHATTASESNSLDTEIRTPFCPGERRNTGCFVRQFVHTNKCTATFPSGNAATRKAVLEFMWISWRTWFCRPTKMRCRQLKAYLLIYESLEELRKKSFEYLRAFRRENFQYHLYQLKNESEMEKTVHDECLHNAPVWETGMNQLTFRTITIPSERRSVIRLDRDDTRTPEYLCKIRKKMTLKNKGGYQCLGRADIHAIFHSTLQSFQLSMFQPKVALLVGRVGTAMGF